jgi:hypothetical protein
MANKRIKIAGYAKRIFFNDNIEYRNFSPDLVGFQLTSEGGTTLFTNGNFSLSVNLDPKPDVLFIQGTRSKLFCLDDISTQGDVEIEIQNNIKAKLNIDLTDPLSYIWYGSSKELIRASLIEIQEKWVAAIYVDNKVGSVTGNNITDYLYDISADESTFKVNSNFFINPYDIKYTVDAQFTSTESNDNPLRNFTLKYGSYVIEHNGISRNIKSITPATQKTNSEIELVVDGNPFPELTGMIIPQISFLVDEVDGSIPYFIKPNETESEKFFTELNDFQRTILNRDITPKYRAEIISTNYTDDGVLLTSKNVYDFPILEDGYNLNFFDTFYLAYLEKLSKLGEGLDGSKTDVIFRKYITEAISSFDTVPRGDGEDLTLNGEKATRLVRIYGVEFDYIKKYINGIKFAHVVTYNKKNNLPDVLVKDLAFMLGLEPINFITDASLSKLYLPSEGDGEFSGTSVNLTQGQIDIELYRRLILNIAWLWKSKGSRKAVEFLFRFIGAPESLVNFNEYVVLVDKPLDIEEIKRLLYVYTGEVNLANIPYDDEGFPLPPIDGDFVITDFIDPVTGDIVTNGFSEMYFQKAGGWYRETYGSNVLTVLNGNNPHIGPYDGGSEYLQYFSRCYIPNFDNEPTITITADTILQNYFINYNYGIFNGIPTGTTDFYTTQLTYNSNTGVYQPIDNCLEVNYSIIETPLQNDGKTTLQQAFGEAELAYNEFLERIKKDSYLVYSPEWQIIKNNYELSLNNCLGEIESEDCDINKTLEICLNQIEPESVEYSCDELTLSACSPFYYFTNEDGIKVSFDEFPQCCTAVDSDARYISYVNEYGRVTEYCSAKAPCVGTPTKVNLESGIVVFSLTNNTQPDNIYQTNSGCVQFIGDTTKFFDFFGTTPQDFLNNPPPLTSSELLEYNKILSTFFVKVDCNSTAIVSSPECCAWHGFDYAIINLDDNGTVTPVGTGSGTIKPNPISDTAGVFAQQGGTTKLPTTRPTTGGISVETKEQRYVVCIRQNELSTPEQNELVVAPTLLDSDIGYLLPIIDNTVNTSYYDLQNPIGGVQDYLSTEIFWDCFEESRIIKESIDGAITVAKPNAIIDDINDPSNNLMDPSNWEIHAIDEYGRVSFTPTTFDNNFIIDWYSDGQLIDLYQDIAEYYGFGFGTFTIDPYNGTLIPYTGDNPYSTNPNTVFTAAVDPDRISCDKFNNVDVVFGSENWGGFKLPQLEDCSCTIDFSFDYMLKYEASKLIECADNISCHPAIFHDNTIDNINCLNFIAFTNSEEESEILQNNFNENDGNRLCRTCTNNTDANTEEYVIWQNTNVLEPNVECCNAIGGNVVAFTEWAQINQNWINEINVTYENLFDSTIEIPSFINREMMGHIKDYTSIKSDLEKILRDCYPIDLLFPPCDIDYSNYITNQNVCSIEVPLECGIWTKILSDYNSLEGAIETIIDRYSIACESDTHMGASESTLEAIDDIKIYNRLSQERDEELNTLKDEENKLREEIGDIENQTNQKESDNTIIEKALTNINNSLDCSIYGNKLTELRNFNYRTYCNSVVYGDATINNGTKQSEYESCISSKTLENQSDQLLYSELLNDCRSKNTLEGQLKDAKFENNQTLIDQIEKELSDVSKNINTLTTNVNNSINYDESKQKSQLDENDTQNTINRTAELLGVSPEDITDNSGNLTLTDSQKVVLNIILNKNKSQISDLNGNLEDKSSLLGDNLVGQRGVIDDTNNEQNVLKAGLGPGKDGPGGPDVPLIYGCNIPLGAEFTIVGIPSYRYVIASPSQYANNMEPSYYVEQWTEATQFGEPGKYKKGPCYAYRYEVNEEPPTGGPGVSTEANPVFEEPDFGVGIVGDGDSTVKGCPKPNDTGWRQSGNPQGQLLFNSVPLNRECCSSEVVGFNVVWTENGCFPSNISQQCEDINPLAIDSGVVLNYSNSVNGASIPRECCTKDILGLDVAFINGECRLNNNPPVDRCCEVVNIDLVKDLLEKVQTSLIDIEQSTTNCYDNWYQQLVQNYEVYEEENNSYFDTYLDDLKINFKLFVNNSNVNSNNSIDTGLTYLPYTESINPIWEWDPTNGYTGVLLEGSEQEIALIEDGIFNHLSQLNIPYNADMFEPEWQTFNFTIPECVCDDLRRLYPDKEFFFSVEIENYECSLCLLVDNIKVNVADCQTNRILSINDCMIPQLSCVIDNKKSWVYYDDGVIKETIYPNGGCNTGSTSNYDIIKLGKEQERLWLDLEYRYTDYNVNHSDLLLNVKNTTFSIDPAKAIECDVFNYWKNIDCDNCPTKCIEDSKVFEDTDDFLYQDCNTYIFEDQSTLHSVVFSGEVLNSGYTLTFDDIVTTGLTFSCSTYTDLLEQKVLELKNKYYILTSDYIESLDATYQQLLDKGQELSDFYIQENNCGTDTIVLNDNSSLNNLFAIITENYDGTLSIFENYLYTGTTPYSGGVLSEVLTGVTAQTYNQKQYITQECCENINELLNGEGSGGLGLGKNYQWDSSNCFCTWKPLDDCANCKGDCEYCGSKKECVDGVATGDTYSVCINPLDYLDIQPSEINIKSVFDQLVQTNLIDVKSRQTISDYPMLRLFYQLYLNASNCGKDLSGKFTYDTMFEFMDKIGDYWLDLIEQVVPATTIWEGCDNSGKIYRNTIFDQNKFNYKKYSLNFIDVENDCPLSAQTEFSIGSESLCTLVEQKPIYPTNEEIVGLKNDILNKEVEITLLVKDIKTINSRLCSLNLQDLDTPDLQSQVESVQLELNTLNELLVNLNNELNDLKNQLQLLEQEYISQQQNYYTNFMSCSGITQNLVNAQNNLSGFTQGTTSYERQRNFIAGLRDKYYKCIRKSNTLISEYNTVFITQTYDSNEYEGNVIITGDPDFDTPEFTEASPPIQVSGWYYNQELIHNCEDTL